MTTVNPAVAAKVKAAVAKVLADQYGPQTVFDPIVVVPRDDGDGEEYLHVYMVFDEDTTKIDTHKDIQFLGLLAEVLGEGATREVLAHSFIPKSEWPDFSRNSYVVPR
jgi:hypothetical protein